MIAEVRVPRGLCNIIPDLFIKFNSLLETACTHDLGTRRYGKAPGTLLTDIPCTPPHSAERTHTHIMKAHKHMPCIRSEWRSNTHTHLITHLPPPLPSVQSFTSPALPFVSNANLSLDEAAFFCGGLLCAFVVCFL